MWSTTNTTTARLSLLPGSRAFVCVCVRCVVWRRRAKRSWADCFGASISAGGLNCHCSSQWLSSSDVVQFEKTTGRVWLNLHVGICDWALEMCWDKAKFSESWLRDLCLRPISYEQTVMLLALQALWYLQLVAIIVFMETHLITLVALNNRSNE